MSLYLSNPNVWAPQDSMAANWMGVLVPSDQKEIATREEYLTLLCDRLEWLIYQWQSEEPNLVSPYSLIHQAMIRAGMLQPLPSLQDSPWQWSEAVILHNPVLIDKINLELAVDFPIPVLSHPDEIEANLNRIADMQLEEWLSQMSAD